AKAGQKLEKKVEKKVEKKTDKKLTTAVVKADEPKAKKVKTKKDDTGDAYRVLIRPMITEKGSFLGMSGQYLFEVATSANKVEVVKAIKKVYGVTPISVRMMNVTGKKIRYGRSEGRTKRWKKAIVSLPAGQKIEIQEGL
ncbi:MAG: 50S ribosomal protein L23, partial [Patescibacteria group bacterium]